MSVWGSFGIDLGPIWDRFGADLETIWEQCRDDFCDLFGITFTPIWDHFGDVFFGEGFLPALDPLGLLRGGYSWEVVVMEPPCGLVIAIQFSWERIS